ncbi:MAG: NlpC/P60 family protein [Anaerovoracaceae bacterium]|jgi:cell wall-associated NlpC family hydrolase
MFKRTITIIFTLALAVSMMAVPQVSAAGSTESTVSTQAAESSTSSSDVYAAPSAVTLKATRSGNTIKLSWNACDRADWYILFYVDENGNTVKRICTTKKLSYTDTDKSSDAGYSYKIKANQSYSYMVIARNVTDKGYYNTKSNVVTVSAAASQTGSTKSSSDDVYAAPSAVTLKASRSGNTIKLSWNSAARADWYILYYADKNGKPYKRICTTKKLSFTDTDKSSDSGYSYKIRSDYSYRYMVIARNVTDKGYYNTKSNVVTVSAAASQTGSTKSSSDDVYAAPSAVTLKASRSGNTIKLSWNSAARADWYILYYADKNGKPYKRICTTKKLSFTDTDKSSDSGYSYKIRSDYSYRYMVIARNMTDIGSFNTKSNTALVKKASGLANLMKVAKSKLGCRYVWGAAGPNTFDCSGYVWYCYKASNASTKKFSRSTAAGYYSSLGSYRLSTTSISYAKPGDILLFSHGSGSIDHAGIYCGSGYMYHASSSSTGVIKSPVIQGTRRVRAIIRMPGVN